MPKRWKGPGPEWWPETEQWPPRTGARRQAWSGFGRHMFARVLLFFAMMLLVPIVIGAAIGAGVSGATGAARAGAVALTVLLIGAFAFIMIWLAVRSWRPVRRLIEAAGNLSEGDYSIRVEPAGSRWLRSVIDSFNDMASQLESAQEQRRRLLADVGHELRTPLTVLRGELEAMIDGVHPPDEEHLRPLLDDVEVMERLLEDLRTLSLAEAGALALDIESTDLGQVISDVADSYRRDAAEAGVEIAVDSGSVSAIDVDPVRMREVISNLVVNAMRAMPEGGRLEVSARQDDGRVVVAVRDTGVGIPDEAHDRVFDRFQKGTGSPGVGLGLTISRDLVEAHGGTIRIADTSPSGTTIHVELPQ